MKRVNTIWLVSIIIVAGNTFAGTYSGGTGDPNDPYLIGSADDILEMSNEPNDWDDNFLMIADVNMVGYTFTEAVIAPDTDNTNGAFDGIPFNGVFNGGGNIILNLTIDTVGVDNDAVGLFGKIDEQGQIYSLGLKNVTIIGGDYSGCLGSFCGRNSGTIYNCYAVSSISGRNRIGGLCGFNNGGTISNSYSTASVSGLNYLGGLCGYSQWATISNSYTTGSVTGEIESNYLGGLCGRNYDGEISNSYATSSVMGGVNSYCLGGLCGWNHFGIINNCYATGPVGGGAGSSDLGGLCGDNNGGTITNSFWDIVTSGTTDGIGNLDPDPNGVMGLDTVMMQSSSTYTDAGWDFIDIWDIGENQTYPYLRTYSPADMNKDGIVNLLDFTILAERWMNGVEKIPTMTYTVGQCDMGGELLLDNELRFTIKVDGSFMDFADLIYANCCIEDGIRLDMMLEGNVITITETELSPGLCLCMCNYPTTARLGPFEPGTYIVQVNQVDYSGFITFIGEMEVIITED